MTADQPQEAGSPIYRYLTLAQQRPASNLDERARTEFLNSKAARLMSYESSLRTDVQNRKIISEHLADYLKISEQDRGYFSLDDYFSAIRNRRHPKFLLARLQDWEMKAKKYEMDAGGYLTVGPSGSIVIDLSPIDVTAPDSVQKAAGALTAIRNYYLFATEAYGMVAIPTTVETVIPSRNSAVAQAFLKNNPHTFDNRTRDSIKRWAMAQDVGFLHDLSSTLVGADLDKTTRSNLITFLTDYVSEKVVKVPEPVGDRSGTDNEPDEAGLANATRLLADQAIERLKKDGSNYLDSYSDLAIRQQESIVFSDVAVRQLPDRMPLKQLEESAYIPIPNAGQGGIRQKSLFMALDEGLWSLTVAGESNPSTTFRCIAESIGSEVMALGGIPVIPTYWATVNGQQGAMRPLVASTGTLAPDPSTYSQADVDALTRMQVGLWLTGNHAVQPANIIRLDNGSLVLLDQDQAFDLLGIDSLDLDYRPYARVGVRETAWQNLVKAAQRGQLKDGVSIRPEAANDVLAAFASIPDGHWDRLVRPVGVMGVMSNSPGWIIEMKDAAAQAEGCSMDDVTDEAVIDQFVQASLDRKNSLRKTLVSYLGSLDLG